MIIRVLESADANDYRTIRLKALLEHPDAFLAIYEQELEQAIDAVQQKLHPSESKFTLGGFGDDGQLAAIVTFVRETNPKISHKGHVVGMYVSPDSRGKRVGYTLLSELLKRAAQCVGLEQIKLTVVANNLAAKRLYESVGFNVYGTERNALRIDGDYLDEDLMVVFL